jgi:hypothetical protein
MSAAIMLRRVMTFIDATLADAIEEEPEGLGDRVRAHATEADAVGSLIEEALAVAYDVSWPARMVEKLEEAAARLGILNGRLDELGHEVDQDEVVAAAEAAAEEAAQAASDETRDGAT